MWHEAGTHRNTSWPVGLGKALPTNTPVGVPARPSILTQRNGPLPCLYDARSVPAALAGFRYRYNIDATTNAAATPKVNMA